MVPQLNIQPINRKQQSTWDEKKRRLAVREKQLFVQLAEQIKDSFGRKRTYKEAWE